LLPVGRGVSARPSRAVSAAVAITYSQSLGKANEVVKAIEKDGGKAITIQADGGHVAAAKRSVAEAAKAFDRLDILVNKAGVFSAGTVDKVSLEDFDRMAETLKGYMAIKRFGRGEEIASLVAYLAGLDAAFITGASLKVDGWSRDGGVEMVESRWWSRDGGVEMVESRCGAVG
jgi:NAD(P)-dependent dehydrogenase (short-subunit alcohol dehydrogenase family)